MRFLRRFLTRLTNSALRRRDDGRLKEEIEEHIALQTAENLRVGLSTAEARRQAMLNFGAVETMKEEYRAERGLLFIDTLLRDIRYAFRMLRKSPGFTTIAVLTLALGIGANTAIFSAVNGIWLEPLLNVRSSRMVTVDLLSIPEIRAIQQQSTAFQRMAIYRLNGSLILGGGTPMDAVNSYVSDDFFPLLGVKPLLGRPILPGDTQPGHALVAVLSYKLWMDDFGGNPHIVGRRISVDRKPYTVIGVMPKGFGLGVALGGDSNPGLWMPSAFPPSNPMNRGRFSSFVARLKDGVTVSQVKAQLNAIYARLEQEYPKQYPKAAGRYGRYGWVIAAGIQGGLRLSADLALLQTALFILLGAVGFVLLLACINVASLLVARAWTRQTEFAIRRALGATRQRIAQQLLSESLLLALAGGALGLFFSMWGIHILRVMAPPYTPRVDRIRLDSNVLWFTLAISLFAALVAGLTPALHASSRRMGGTLKGGLGGSFAGVAMRSSHRLQSTLVILEVALAVIVVAGGALMGRSFYNLMHVNTGVRADHVVTMSVALSDLVCNYSAPAKRPKKEAAKTQKAQKEATSDENHPAACALASENILDGIRSLPGVEEAALAETGGPFQGSMLIQSFRYPGGPSNPGLWIEGRTGNQLSGAVQGSLVTPGFFGALGIRLLRGRDFGPTDWDNSHVAIVSQSFARKYIPGNPLGKRFSISTDKKGRHQWMQIIGEVNDVRDRAVHESGSGPVFYVPFWFGNNWCMVIARASTNPMVIVPAIERVVRSVDADAPITKIETVDQIIANSVAEPKFQAGLLGSFGTLGLILAIIGIFGVISYSVVQRTHEIGVRVALGAQPGNVLHMIIGEGMLLAGTGIALGIGGALALTRFLRSLLFEIQPTDPLTFAGVAILLALVALAACYIPARGATRVDPMVALRYE